VETNSLGQFDVIIPGDQLKDEMPLAAIKQGYVRWDSKAVPDANPLDITLKQGFTPFCPVWQRNSLRQDLSFLLERVQYFI
jgi:hypothetical protein